MSGSDPYTGLGRCIVCENPSPHIRYNWQPNKHSSFDASSVLTLGRKPCLYMRWLVRHVGRRSGKPYETVIMVWPLRASFVIALTYGPKVDWYQNLLAAGGGVEAIIARGYGLATDATIADELNARGHQTIDTKTGRRGRFEREGVRTILRNRAYLGYVSSGGVEYPGQHAPLIGVELWATV